MKKVILFCGVESTGKSTAISELYKYLTSKKIKTSIVSEVGRDICEDSGGVFDMTLMSYEQILFAHQSNFLKAYANNKNDVILLDTDSTYTRYYLEKDNNLNKLSFAKNLIKLSEDIVKNNISTRKIIPIYLNSDCPFVQDGTRTYEKTRKQDDEVLFNLYKKAYNNLYVVSGKKWEDRINQIKNILDKILI